MIRFCTYPVSYTHLDVYKRQILHPTTQQFFYWEHFGMMDKNNYCDAACNKLKSYCYNGIFPSMQLITTYETGKVPIRSEQVQQIITQYFL